MVYHQVKTTAGTIFLSLDVESGEQGARIFVTDSGDGAPHTVDTSLNFGLTPDGGCRADEIVVDTSASELTYNELDGTIRAGDSLVAIIYPELPEEALSIEGTVVKRNCQVEIPEFAPRSPVQSPRIRRFIGAERLPFIALEPGTQELPIPGCPPSTLDDDFVINLLPDGPQACDGGGQRVTFDVTELNSPLPVFDTKVTEECPGKSYSQRLVLAEFGRPASLSLNANNDESVDTTQVHVFRGCESGLYFEPSVLRATVGPTSPPALIVEPGAYALLVTNLCESGFQSDITIVCDDAPATIERARRNETTTRSGAFLRDKAETEE